MGDSDRFQRHDGSGRPNATADREDRLTVRSAVTAFYCYQPSDVRPAYQCPPGSLRDGQRADLAFTIAHHTSPQTGVMVWGAISFDSRASLVVSRGTLTAQWYVDDILRTVLLPFLLRFELMRRDDVEATGIEDDVLDI
ncbi:transposable element Tc1 transposase [Trichonephila clavipes]|nr:transposable element Tc1 transposase [Trichonephila clavipes]